MGKSVQWELQRLLLYEVLDLMINELFISVLGFFQVVLNMLSMRIDQLEDRKEGE